MRGIFVRDQPELARILLIESGGRNLLNEYVPAICRAHPDGIVVDLVTCFAGVPEGFQETGTVYRVADYASPEARAGLVRELKSNGYSAAGMICSGEAIMTKWKWMLALRLPLKVFVVNENVDVFWLDWTHASVVRHFVLFRAGLTGAGAVPTLARLALLPFTVAFLVAYAAWEHVKRRLRLLTAS